MVSAKPNSGELRFNEHGIPMLGTVQAAPIIMMPTATTRLRFNMEDSIHFGEVARRPL
jgi:hypothetical protein